MAKFYVMSDVHGHFDEMIEALDKAGFDSNNPEHWLISLGDNFDRGPKNIQVMRYLRMLERCIGVKGNHEDLLLQCCERGYPGGHDYGNGTFDAVCEFGDAGEGYSFDECCTRTLARVGNFIDNMVDYFETKNYIFVHSWIPLACKDNLPKYYTKKRKFEFNPDWRNASASEWEDARWGNPFDLAEQGFLPEKTVVFGHWGVEHKWAEIELRQEYGKGAHFEPYYGDGYIGIDATTAYSGKVNVLVLEDEFLE